MKARQRRNRGTRTQKKTMREPKPSRVNSTIPLGLGFADTTRVTLVYTDTLAISSAAYQTIYSFRGNSVYDPDFSGAGHQPAYYDTYSEVYSRYKVYGCSIDIKYTNTTGDSIVCSIIPSTQNLGVGASPSALLDLPRARWSIAGTANIMPASIRHKASTSEILGLTSRQIEDDDYSALTTTNPNQIWYWNIYVSHLDTSKLNVGMACLIRIIYDVKFFDKVFISPSYTKPVSPSRPSLKR